MQLSTQAFMPALVQAMMQASPTLPRHRRCRLLKQAAAGLAAAAGLSGATAQTTAPALPLRPLDSCVAGNRGITLGMGDHMALLDARDAVTLHAGRPPVGRCCVDMV